MTNAAELRTAPHPLTIEETGPTCELGKSVKCAYCGKSGPWSTHSGLYECGACWDWRKLDSAAARYWFIISKFVISSVDRYDLTSFFPNKIGMTPEEIKAFGSIIEKMHDSVEAMAKEHHRDEDWTKQAEGLWDQLVNGLRPKPE